MDIIINKDVSVSSPTAVALGNFDGIHLGHEVLIKRVIDESKEKSIIPSVFTFSNHTSRLLKNNSFGYLINNDQKKEILQNMGLSLLYMIDFKQDIRQMCPEDFVKKILVNRLNAKLIVVGFNYRFGFMGEGDPDKLKLFGKKYGFEVIVIKPIIIDGNVVSSSLIRQQIKAGEIENANHLLGRKFTLEGKIVNGKGIGKKLGFATANLELNCNYVLPKLGVYKTTTYYKGESYSSITNVGYAPTFNSDEISIETHIFNLNENLYESTLSVSFDKYIREEKKFNNKHELIKQVKDDIRHAKA